MTLGLQKFGFATLIGDQRLKLEEVTKCQQFPDCVWFQGEERFLIRVLSLKDKDTGGEASEASQK